MRHVIFQSKSDADAFLNELRSGNHIQVDMHQRNFRTAGSSTAAAAGVTDTRTSTYTHTDGGTAEDAGAGAVKGTVVGAGVGAAAGAIGTAATGAAGAATAAGAAAAGAATLATGGLALPVILGMAALGSGVGAAIGAAGGAAGVNETGDEYYEVDETRYRELHDSHAAGQYPIAIDDSVPFDVVRDAAARHNGRIVG